MLMVDLVVGDASRASFAIACYKKAEWISLTVNTNKANDKGRTDYRLILITTTQKKRP